MLLMIHTDWNMQTTFFQPFILHGTITQSVLVCRSSLLDHSNAETSSLSDNHVQRQSSLGRASQGSGEPGAGIQPTPSHQSPIPDNSRGEHSAPLSRGQEILDCLMSGLRLALQWHLQHRYPDVWVQVCAVLHRTGSLPYQTSWLQQMYLAAVRPRLCGTHVDSMLCEQEMAYMSDVPRLLERLLSWPHVLDLFTTVQADDERQIMQALQQLKLFSSDPEHGDLWRAAECGRVVLSSFSRPLSTGDTDQTLCSDDFPACHLLLRVLCLFNSCWVVRSLCCWWQWL